MSAEEKALLEEIRRLESGTVDEEAAMLDEVRRLEADREKSMLSEVKALESKDNGKAVTRPSLAEMFPTPDPGISIEEARDMKDKVVEQFREKHPLVQKSLEAVSGGVKDVAKGAMELFDQPPPVDLRTGQPGGEMPGYTNEDEKTKSDFFDIASTEFSRKLLGGAGSRATEEALKDNPLVGTEMEEMAKGVGSVASDLATIPAIYGILGKVSLFGSLSKGVSAGSGTARMLGRWGAKTVEHSLRGAAAGGAYGLYTGERGKRLEEAAVDAAYFAAFDGALGFFGAPAKEIKGMLERQLNLAPPFLETMTNDINVAKEVFRGDRDSFLAWLALRGGINNEKACYDIVMNSSPETVKAIWGAREEIDTVVAEAVPGRRGAKPKISETPAPTVAETPGIAPETPPEAPGGVSGPKGMVEEGKAMVAPPEAPGKAAPIPGEMTTDEAARKIVDKVTEGLDRLAKDAADSPEAALREIMSKTESAIEGSTLRELPATPAEGKMWIEMAASKKQKLVRERLLGKYPKYNDNPIGLDIKTWDIVATLDRRYHGQAGFVRWPFGGNKKVRPEGGKVKGEHFSGTGYIDEALGREMARGEKTYGRDWGKVVDDYAKNGLKLLENIDERMEFMHLLRKSAREGAITNEQVDLFIYDSDVLKEKARHMHSEVTKSLDGYFYPVWKNELSTKKRTKMINLIGETLGARTSLHRAKNWGVPIYGTEETLQKWIAEINNPSDGFLRYMGLERRHVEAVKETTDIIMEALVRHGRTWERFGILKPGTVDAFGGEYAPIAVLNYFVEDMKLGWGKGLKYFEPGHAKKIKGSEYPTSINSYEVMRQYFMQFERSRILQEFYLDIKKHFHNPEKGLVKVTKDGKEVMELAEGWAKLQWHPENIATRSNAIANTVLNRMEEDLVTGAGPMSKEMEAAIREIREEMSAGKPINGEDSTIIIPEAVAKKMNEFYEVGKWDPAYKHIFRITRFWKKQMVRSIGLWNPAFILRNHITDGLALLRDVPGAYRYMATSALYNFRGQKTPAEVAKRLERTIIKDARRIARDSLSKSELAEVKRLAGGNAAREGDLLLSRMANKGDSKSAFLTGEEIEELWGTFTKAGGGVGFHGEIFHAGGTPYLQGPSLHGQWHKRHTPLKAWRYARGYLDEGIIQRIRGSLEGSFRFAAYLEHYRMLKESVLAGKAVKGYGEDVVGSSLIRGRAKREGVMDMEWLKEFGPSVAWEKMGKTMINYGHFPDWQIRYMSNAAIPFWGFFAGNAKSWHNAIVHGSGPQRMRAIAMLTLSGVGLPTLAWMYAPDAMNKLYSKDYLKYTQGSLFFPASNEPNERRMYEFWRTQTGGGDILNLFGIKDLGELYIPRILGLKSWDDYTLGEYILKTMAAPPVSAYLATIEKINPIPRRLLVEYPYNKDLYTGRPIWKKDDRPLEVTFKIGADAIQTGSRTTRDFLSLLNGNETFYKWLDNVDSEYPVLSEWIGEDMPAEVKELLSMRSYTKQGKTIRQAVNWEKITGLKVEHNLDNTQKRKKKRSSKRLTAIDWDK